MTRAITRISIEKLTRNVQFRTNFLCLFRQLFLPIACILIFAILFNYAQDWSHNKNISLRAFEVLRLIGICGLLGYLGYKIFRIEFASKAEVLRNIEIASNVSEVAPLSRLSEKIAIGDKQLWQLSEHGKNEALSLVKAPKLLRPNDWGLIFIFSLTAIFFALGFAKNIQSLRPNIAIIIDGAPIEMSAIATPPVYTKQMAIDLFQANNVQSANKTESRKYSIVQNSSVEIRINGTKFAPIISYGSFKTKMRLDNSGTWIANIVLKRSANLKIHHFGTQITRKIKVIADKKPGIDKNFTIANAGNENFMLGFRAFDDYQIERAVLVLQSGKFIQTQIEIDHSAIIANETSNISVPFGYSALVGMRAKAHIEVYDANGQMAKTKTQNIDIPNPNFSTKIAKSLQEVRILLLRETSEYRPIANNYMWVNDTTGIGKIRIIATNNIDYAPTNIRRAYDILADINSIRAKLGLSLVNSIGLTHALHTIEYAKKTKDAQFAADTLWSMIEDIENGNIDSQSKVANAIQNLKNALQNNASSLEIEMLKSELKTAINEHFEALKNQSGESGDMEIADDEIAGKINVDEVLDGAENDVRNGDSQDAMAKLDELNHMLSQMQPSNNGGGQSIQFDGVGQSNQSGENEETKLAQAQQELADQTIGGTSLEELITKQEALLSQLPQNNPEIPNDAKANEARAAMDSALSALRNGDRKEAQKAQQAAADILKGRSAQNPLNGFQNQNGDDGIQRDPLGRKIQSDSDTSGKSARGAQNGRETKLPPGAKPANSQNILQKIRDRLSNPNQSEEERNYLENAIAN